MKLKKFLLIFFGVPIGVILIFALLILANNIYQLFPHHITKVEDIQYLISDFEDMPIESCDCQWQADVMFMGGALETHSSGKLYVSKEYYDSIMQKYQWREASGIPFQVSQISNSEKVLGKVYYNFVTKEQYLISEDYQEEFYPIVIASKDEYAIYFFYKTF